MQSWFRRAYGAVDGVISADDPFPDCDRPATLALRLGLDPAFRPRAEITRGRHVLYVGRLSPQKGIFELLAAARSAEPWTLMVVGSGPAAAAVEARTRRLGLADRVAFRPHISDRDELARTYSAASCVAMPGAYETFGLVGLEAAASGARVAAASNAASAGIAAELVERFAPGDVDGLLAAIERARARPPDLAAAGRLGQRLTWARAFAAEIEDLERLAG